MNEENGIFFKVRFAERIIRIFRTVRRFEAEKNERGDGILVNSF